MAKRKVSSDKEPTQIRPALLPENRENQMISLAYNLVEQRLLDGSASSQETTFFLKLGSSREKLEKQLLEEKAKLESIKADTIAAEQKSAELYEQAIAAFKRYSGHSDEEDGY